MTAEPTDHNFRSPILVIQDEMRESFGKLNVPILTVEFDMPQLDEYALEHCQRLNLDPEEGCRRIRDIWWAIASAQLGLGYMIVAKDSTYNPRGSIQKVAALQELQIDFNISDLHFWHHTNLAIECLYRIWERLTNLLRFFTGLTTEKKLYFDGFVQALKDDSRFKELSSLKDVSKNIKHWNTVCGKRNHLSHEGSRLFGDDRVTVEEYDILKPAGDQFAIMTTRSPDLVQVVEEIKERFVRCGQAFESVMQLIEELPNQRIQSILVPSATKSNQRIN